MEVKPRNYYEPKKAGGINLRLSVWERVEQAAKDEGVSKSHLMEAILDEHLPTLPDFRNIPVDEKYPS